MEMLRAEYPLAAGAHATADEIESSFAHVALGAHVRAREDSKESHLGQRSFAAPTMTTDHGRFALLLLSGRTFAIVHTTIVAQPP